MEDYIREFAAKCPGRALSLEVIVTGPRFYNYRDPKFWDAYRRTPAWEFARFLALAEKGTPHARRAAAAFRRGRRRPGTGGCGSQHPLDEGVSCYSLKRKLMRSAIFVLLAPVQQVRSANPHTS